MWSWCITTCNPLWLRSTSLEDTIRKKKLETKDTRNTVSLERADSRTSHDPWEYIPLLKYNQLWCQAWRSSWSPLLTTISSCTELVNHKIYTIDNIFPVLCVKLAACMRLSTCIQQRVVNPGRKYRAIGSKYVMVRLIAYNNERAAGEL